MAITAQAVKALRERTGTGMMDSKRAVEATDGDLEKAIDWLRRKGIARASAQAGRVAREGVIEIYVHHNHQLGVLLELNSESDFVARSAEFRELAHEIAVHIAAATPRFLRREDVPDDVVEARRTEFREAAVARKKPAQVVQNIVDGKLNEFFKDRVLLDQPWAKDDKRTVSDVLHEGIAKLGENITVARFARFKVRDEAELPEAV